MRTCDYPPCGRVLYEVIDPVIEKEYSELCGGLIAERWYCTRACAENDHDRRGEAAEERFAERFHAGEAGPGTEMARAERAWHEHKGPR